MVKDIDNKNMMSYFPRWLAEHEFSFLLQNMS